MDVIKEYGGSKNLKHIRYTHEDAKELKERFRTIDADLIDMLCARLKETNQVIDAIGCYDSQSGWTGTDFYIGKANLSLNGYCLSNKQILDFIEDRTNKQWYPHYSEEYKRLEK